MHDLRLPEGERVKKPFSEIELPVYPHLPDEIAQDPRLLQLIEALTQSLRETFSKDELHAYRTLSEIFMY
ncbi:hypothetical protein [Streptomyces jumonjinensis]|uniref:hypothetical protein n=1 Tax=Streptomyces jumonjinensis TaxID=1945 RepID=UPI0037A8AE25